MTPGTSCLRPSPNGTDAFLWGVATSGYQSEGGYNALERPHNNWWLAESTGAVMRTGHASDFWVRYEQDFQTCRRLGLNGFRLSLEWARVQPTSDGRQAPPPPFDAAALDAYAERLAACRRHGLEPVVTLHHFTHPAWLGPDAWLADEVVGLFAEFVRVAVTHVNRRLVRDGRLEPVRWYVTINEPNILVLNSYLGNQFPAGARHGRSALLRAYNHLLAAHVRAYNTIHDVYLAEGWPTPRVSLNTFCSDLYWSDKLLWDLLSLRRRRVKPARLRDHVSRKAQELERALLAARLPFPGDLAYLAGRAVHFLADHLGARAFDRKHFAFYLKELYAAPRADVYDFVGVDYYDPFLAHGFRLPTFQDLEFESKSLHAWLMDGVTRKWWDWRSLPEGLHFFCKFYAEDLGRPVLIAENGMALRRKADNSAADRRTDRLTRSAHLDLHVRQVLRLLDEGVPLLGYLHWSLTDNYEWGSFTPRFGLYSIDFATGTERLAEDHLGDRPAETYARLVAEARGRKATALQQR